MASRRRFILKTFSISSLIFTLLLFGAIWFAYNQYKHGSLDRLLQYKLQQVLNDNHIPIEITKLKLKADPKEFLNGKIQKLDIEIKHTQMGISAHLQTPVQYELKTSSIHIEIEPKLLSKGLPDVSGKISSDIYFDRVKTKISLNRIESKMNLNSLEPIHYHLGSAEISLESIASSMYIDAKLGENPNLSTTIQFLGILPKYISGSLEISDQSVAFVSKFQTNFSTVEDFEFILTDPLPFHLSGKVSDLKSDLKPDLKYHFQYSLKKLLKRARELVNIPILRQIVAEGLLKMDGEITGTIREPDLDSTLTIQSPNFQIIHPYTKKQIVSFENLKLEVPVYYPLDEAQGSISSNSMSLFDFKFNDLLFEFLSHPEKIELTMNRAIRTGAFGNFVNIDNLQVRIPFYPEDTDESETRLPTIDTPIVVSTSISGGPFSIERLQKEFCIADQKPIPGMVTILFPKIFNSKSGFHALGSADFTLLGGSTQVSDVRYYWGSDHPKLAFNSRWDDLDLHEIGDLIKFGDMRGSLDGSLRNAVYALTDIGPIPLQYDFIVQGKPRSGKVIRFYGRAVDNILELLGSRKQEMPWYAKWFIDMSMGFRNYFPATADYMGFRAKTEGGWTELYTFDPPDPEYSPGKEKIHYILSGTAFKIPLNTHGVYPAIMKTEAFQGWLWGMVDYFRKLSEEKKDANSTSPSNGDSECIPFWRKSSVQ